MANCYYTVTLDISAVLAITLLNWYHTHNIFKNIYLHFLHYFYSPQNLHLVCSNWKCGLNDCNKIKNCIEMPFALLFSNHSNWWFKVCKSFFQFQQKLFNSFGQLENFFLYLSYLHQQNLHIYFAKHKNMYKINKLHIYVFDVQRP